MKNRNLPYGYRYENGDIVTNPEEVKVLNEIFHYYLGGYSLLKIADILNGKKVEYAPDIIGWNKSRIMRLIEDERYVGTDTFPPIITLEKHKQMCQLKAQKNTQRATDKNSDIFKLKIPVFCETCGERMHRRQDNRLKVRQKWICTNCSTIIGLPDEILLKEITELLNILIERPDLVAIEPVNRNPNERIISINKDIENLLDASNVNRELLRTKIMELVSVKYDGISSIPYIARQLKADLEKASPLLTFSADLCNRIVQSVYIRTDGTLSLKLINGQLIAKEQLYGNRNY